MKAVVIDIRHELDRTELRRRMNAGVTKLSSHIPGGAAEVRAQWPQEDRMLVDVTAMGQDIATTLDLEEKLVRVTVMLPGLLALMAAPIEAVVRRSGEKLLLAAPSEEK